jgi:uncharacterized PurR-regulated membrane protein YhhQ (DUF165 family)
MKPGLFRCGSIALYVSSIPLANWLVEQFGVIGPRAIQAPAGVFVIGLTLAARDLVQWTSGKAVSLGLMSVGLLLSWWVANPALALASAAAFVCSEGLDYAIFTKLRRRPIGAVVASGVFSAVLDSLIFLVIAFGSLAYLPGQLLGKVIGVGMGASIAKLGRRAVG